MPAAARSEKQEWEKGDAMNDTALQRTLIFLMRVSLGWVFLWAAIRQIPDPAWSAAGFLKGAKTFTSFYAFFMQPEILPIVNVLVKYGHLLIGISLILGIGVRLSSASGALLLLMYYFPRLDFPYVGNPSYFIVEYHLFYALALAYLGAIRAGQIVGLENWFAKLAFVAPIFERRPQLRAAFG
jgi:thiosulfate dehydrogenase [quinone] large subunit